jgi:hypothetical protein
MHVAHSLNAVPVTNNNQPQPSSSVQSHLIVQTIMTDAAAAYPLIIAELFPQANHQLCYWHQAVLMSRFCKQHALDFKKSDAAMTSVLRETNKKKAKKLWHAMLAEHFDPQLAEQSSPKNGTVESAAEHKLRKAKNKSKKNARALLRNWYEKREKYWQCYTKNMRNHGSLSSQAGESMNHAVKRRNHVTLLELFNMTTQVVENHIFEQMKSLEQAQRIPLRDDPNYRSWNAILRASLTLYAGEMLTEQLQLAQEFGFSTSKKERVTDLELMQCSCCFVDQQGMMCRHLMLEWLYAHKARESTCPPRSELTAQDLFTQTMKDALATACVAHSDRRWTHAAVLRVIGEVDVRSHQYESDNHHEFISTRPAAPIPESNTMRHLALDALLARMKKFACKDELASRIFLTECSAMLDTLETKYTEARTIDDADQSNQLTLKSEVLILDIEAVSFDKPANSADPVHRKHKRKHIKLSTQEAAKKQLIESRNEMS